MNGLLLLILLLGGLFLNGVPSGSSGPDAQVEEGEGSLGHGGPSP